MYEDKGSQEEWEKIYKRALYWQPEDAVPILSPTQTRAKA